jgi:hypothetical protein
MADQDEEQFGVKFTSTTESVTEAKESFAHLTQEMEQTSKAGEIVATSTKTVDEAAAELRKQIADLNVVLQEQVRLYASGELPIDAFIRGSNAARTVIGNLEKGLESLAPKLEEIRGEGEGESGSGGFAGMASGAMKAEKAIHSLASGTGLGRLGGMLEGVLGPMGVPGLGMALGALAYELEPLIPKIKAFVDAWETGVKPLSDTAEAIERLNRAQGDARQKRALGRIEGQITTLEDKEDTQGFLSAEDTLRLRQLRGAAWAKEQEANAEEAARERKKREEQNRKETDEAVKFATDWGRELDTQQQKEVHQQVEAKRKRVEHAQHIEDEGIIQQADEADRAERDAARAADRQKRDADRASVQAQRQAERDAARAAREGTPEAIEHRARAAEQNETMGVAQEVQSARANYGDVMASQMGPQDLQQVVAQVGRNRMMNSSLGFTLAQQVDFYMGQLEAKMVNDFARGMGQQNRTGQNIVPRGGF